MSTADTTVATETAAGGDLQRPVGAGASASRAARSDAGRPEPRADAGAGAPGASGSGGARSAGRGLRAGFRLLGSELGLVFRRPRNLAALAVLGGVPRLIGVGLP